MKFVQLGYGSIGKRHHKNLVDMGIEPLGVVDPAFDLEIEKVLPTFQEGVYVARGMDAQFRDMIRGNLVIIATPTGMHCEQLERVLQHEPRAVFVEKPFDVDLNIETSIPVAFGYNYRYHPVVRKVKNEMADGGKKLLSMLAYDKVTEWPNYERDGWIGKEWGGALMTSGCHSIDTAQYLLGPVVDVKEASSGFDYDIADSDSQVFATLEHENGSYSIFGIIWNDEYSSSSLYYLDKKHSIHSDMQAYKYDMHFTMMMDFVGLAMGGKTEIATYEDALSVYEVVEEICHMC